MQLNGGLQRITTQEGVTIPLDTISGFPYVNLRPYTDNKWKSFPRIILTLDIK